MKKKIFLSLGMGLFLPRLQPASDIVVGLMVLSTGGLLVWLGLLRQTQQPSPRTFEFLGAARYSGEATNRYPGRFRTRDAPFSQQNNAELAAELVAGEIAEDCWYGHVAEADNTNEDERSRQEIVRLCEPLDLLRLRITRRIRTSRRRYV